MINRGTGFIPPSRWPTRDEAARATQRFSMSRVTSFVPTKLGDSTICDQDGSSECFGFAVAQAIHLWRQAHGVPSKILSPMIPYYEARRKWEPSDLDVRDIGSDPDGMIRALADFGACEWDSAPFDVETFRRDTFNPNEATHWINQRPGSLAYIGAQKLQCRLTPILALGPSLWDALRYSIQVEREAPTIAVEVSPAFDNPRNGIVDDPSGTSRGLHAVAVESFDDQGAWIPNSWGTTYGLNGRVLLTPRFLAARCVWAGSLEVIG